MKNFRYNTLIRMRKTDIDFGKHPLTSKVRISLGVDTEAVKQNLTVLPLSNTVFWKL